MSKLKVKLSVIIPCFNEVNAIATQLEALANQQWSEPWEIIVSDNGSTDESLAIVKQYKERLSNLCVVDSSGRRGSAHARNVGVLAATGDALAFCDADDEVAPGWVAAVGEAISEYDFVVCQIEDEKLNAPWVRAIWNPSRTGPRPHLGYLPAAAAWGIGFKRSLYEAVGEFDESLPRLNDIDYSWRVQLAGTELHFTREAVVHYRYRDTFAGLYHQARLDGKDQVFLYKKYAPLGMPWRSWKAGVRAWVRLLMRFPGGRRWESRAKWIVDFGFVVGRLQGSIKHRILAL